MEMYQSRLRELDEERREFTEQDAVAAYHQYLPGQSTDHMEELTEQGRKRIHNLKYYSWVEQQGKDAEELNAQWNDPEYWTSIPQYGEQVDRLIEQFNERVGLV